MQIEIKKIVDRDLLEQERAVLGVVSDTFLGNFAIFQTHSNSSGTVSTQIKRTYWFPDRDVKAGDIIVIYTKSGKNKVRDNDDGTQSHFFYLGKDAPIWKDDSSALAIINILEWDYKTADGKGGREKI